MSSSNEDAFNEEQKVNAITCDEKIQTISEAVKPVTKKTPAERKKIDIAYKLDDVPPWYLCFILGFQHYLTMFGGTVTYPFLISPKLCIPPGHPTRGYLISTTFFVSGIATFLQTTFGVRLPIVQGSTIALLVPIIAILQLPQWQCPDVTSNSTTLVDWDEVWQSRMREVQGAVIGASVIEVVIGFTGIMGVLLTWITPLSITPIITLVGLSLFAEAANTASGHWGIAFFTIILLALFSQYLREVVMPCFGYEKSKGFYKTSIPIFKLFPVLLTILLAWSLCAILTTTEVFPQGHPARTDLQLNILHNSPWFRFPYPGQWGMPTFSTAAVCGAVAGIMASAIESVGDYYACARLAGAPPPPTHAINRGIWMEGMACVLAGIWGTGGGLTSYSENIGAIGITKVASRRVIQYGSALMILFGVLGKFGALFITIPEPIIGGVFCVMFAMITAVGLSTLQHVDLTSSRNLFVLGSSLFMGLCIPKWLQSHPDVIDTGNQVLTQIVTVFLSTSMFVGGMIGFILDNTLPGTDEERGISKWKEVDTTDPSSSNTSAYDLPVLMPTIRNISLFQYLPVCPTFNVQRIRQRILRLRNRKNMTKSNTTNADLTTSHV